MIPRSAHAVRVTGANVEKKQMTIAANAVAFRALIDGMYADKIGSIMRELWTNAWDSHVEAGKPDTPFKVLLPTSLKPEFEVRDYGVSMTHETVMELFTRMFDSTKRKSNFVAGKFGVGSKSPFAYTDAYVVTCFMDGWARAYSIHLGEDGTPEVALMGEGETEEENGLSVAFPVERKDFTEFKKAASRTAVAFDVKPEINIGDDAFEELPDPLRSVNNWTLYKNPPWYLGPRIKMGCVTYPIDTEFLPDEHATVIELANLVLEIPIGDCDINLSREALSYDEATVKNLRKHVASFVTDLGGLLSDDLAQCSSLSEACTALRKYVEELKEAGVDFKRPEAVEFEGKAVRVIPELPDPLPQYSSFVSAVNALSDERTSGLYTGSRWQGEYRKPSNIAVGSLPQTLVVVTQRNKPVVHLAHRIAQYIEDDPDLKKRISGVMRYHYKTECPVSRQEFADLLCGLPLDQLVFAHELPLDKKKIPGVVITGPYHVTDGGWYARKREMPDDITAYINTSGVHDIDTKLEGVPYAMTVSTLMSAARAVGWNPKTLHMTKKQRGADEELPEAENLFEGACERFTEFLKLGDLTDWVSLAAIFKDYKKDEQKHALTVIWSLVNNHDMGEIIDESDDTIFADIVRSLVALKDADKTLADLTDIEEADHILGFNALCDVRVRDQTAFRRDQLDRFIQDHPLINAFRDMRWRDDLDDETAAEVIAYLNT